MKFRFKAKGPELKYFIFVPSTSFEGSVVPGPDFFNA